MTKGTKEKSKKQMRPTAEQIRKAVDNLVGISGFLKAFGVLLGNQDMDTDNGIGNMGFHLELIGEELSEAAGILDPENR